MALLPPIGAVVLWPIASRHFNKEKNNWTLINADNADFSHFICVNL